MKKTKSMGCFLAILTSIGCYSISANADQRSPQTVAVLRGTDSSGGGDLVVEGFIKAARHAVEYVVHLNQTAVDTDVLMNLLVDSSLKIDAVNVIIDPTNQTPFEQPNDIYAWTRGKYIQLKRDVWRQMINENSSTLYLRAFHELLRATGQYNDENFAISISILNLDKIDTLENWTLKEESRDMGLALIGDCRYEFAFTEPASPGSSYQKPYFSWNFDLFHEYWIRQWYEDASGNIKDGSERKLTKQMLSLAQTSPAYVGPQWAAKKDCGARRDSFQSKLEEDKKQRRIAHAKEGDVPICTRTGLFDAAYIGPIVYIGYDGEYFNSIKSEDVGVKWMDPTYMKKNASKKQAKLNLVARPKIEALADATLAQWRTTGVCKGLMYGR